MTRGLDPGEFSKRTIIVLLLMMETYLLSEIVMIAHKRIESAELHPSSAQLFRRFQSKAANVSADVRDTEHVEVQNGCKKSIACRGNERTADRPSAAYRGWRSTYRRMSRGCRPSNAR